MRFRDRAYLICVYIVVLVAYHVATSPKQMIAEVKPVVRSEYIIVSNPTECPKYDSAIQDRIPIRFYEFFRYRHVTEIPRLREKDSHRNVLWAFEIRNIVLNSDFCLHARSDITGGVFASVLEIHPHYEWLVNRGNPS